MHIQIKAGEMAEGLSTGAALAEDSGSSLSTHKVPHNLL